MKAWVVLTAAGSGSRLGSEVPKALVEVEGASLLERALQQIIDSDRVGGVVVTCPREHLAQFDLLTAQVVGASKNRIVVPGGSSRQSSVFSALRAIDAFYDCAPPASMPVLVHDAARCLAPTELFDSVIEAIDGGALAVIPVLPVVDTIKVVDPITALVQSTPDRSTLRTVQTPQGFRWKPLWQAHSAEARRGQSEADAATDDAALVELYQVPVLTVPGAKAAFKVTVPEDIERLRQAVESAE